jgi:hypothetical protein
MRRFASLLLLLSFACASAHALDLALPTDNNAIRRGDNAGFYQPTVEGTIESGMFGCVRRGGHRFHEGIDIRCLHRDKRGEPLDDVNAIADGTVVFFNSKPGLSNYGRYVILAHRWDGVEIHTLYAHLAVVAAELKIGAPVVKGQRLGALGHSTNTREQIPPERAHLHFEINILLNTHFHLWYPRRDPKAPPFGNYNGQNLFGMDPVPILLRAANPQFNFADYLAHQPIAFTVLVPAKEFPWLKLHPEQIQPTRVEQIAAYEIGATAWGVPIAVWPRADTGGKHLPCVVRVDENALANNGCRNLVQQNKRSWSLTEHGREWLEILTFTP